MPDPLVADWDRMQVRLRGFSTAGAVCPQLDRRTFSHAGPPIAPADLTEPMRAAVVGALLLEGEADTPEAAGRIVDRGGVTLVPCYDLPTIGAMAGVISPSMAVAIAEDDGGRTAFAALGEGAARCLRHGFHDPATLDRARWIATSVVPVLDRAVRPADIGLTRIIRTALQQGDECHSRAVAGSAQLFVQLLGNLLRSGAGGDAELTRVLRWLTVDTQFFVGLAILAARLLADAAHNRAGSPVVTAIGANGREIGIRVSGLGDRWFTAPAPVGRAVLYTGFAAEDASPLMGDSCIAEVVGLGAMALPAGPAVASHLGIGAAETAETYARMRRITVAESDRYRLPTEGFPGLAQGIDVHKVAGSGIAPVINTGLVHRRAGVGQIGAGLAEVPLSVFTAASAALSR